MSSFILFCFHLFSDVKYLTYSVYFYDEISRWKWSNSLDSASWYENIKYHNGVLPFYLVIKRPKSKFNFLLRGIYSKNIYIQIFTALNSLKVQISRILLLWVEFFVTRYIVFSHSISYANYLDFCWLMGFLKETDLLRKTPK